METIYTIKTITGNIIRVTEEIFNNFLYSLKESYPDYETDTDYYEYKDWIEDSKFFIIRKNGKIEVVAQIERRKPCEKSQIQAQYQRNGQ